jgi:hypothetical protein
MGVQATFSVPTSVCAHAGHVATLNIYLGAAIWDNAGNLAAPVVEINCATGGPLYTALGVDYHAGQLHVANMTGVVVAPGNVVQVMVTVSAQASAVTDFNVTTNAIQTIVFQGMNTGIAKVGAFCTSITRPCASPPFMFASSGHVPFSNVLVTRDYVVSQLGGVPNIPSVMKTIWCPVAPSVPLTPAHLGSAFFLYC